MYDSRTIYTNSWRASAFLLLHISNSYLDVLKNITTWYDLNFLELK